MILNEILKQSSLKFSDKPALTMKMGFRTKTFTYKEIYSLSKKVAIFLEQNGINKGDKVLTCVPNSPYWGCVFWGCVLRGAIIVPLNVQSTKQLIDRVAQQTEAKIIFKNLFFKFELDQSIKQYNIEFLQELIPDIDENKFVEQNINDNDLVQIMYTSGTTGDPKGVMLTHNNMYSNVIAFSEIIKISLSKDRVLSILPLSHIYEQTAGFLLPYSHGVHIIYAHSYGAIKNLMKKYQITKMLVVPEFLQLMMSRIEHEVDTKGIKKLFNKMLSWSEKINNIFFSRILFHSVIKSLGGKIDTIASGGAPLDPDLEKKWNALGILILQGYGLTETSPGISTNSFDNYRIGSVGKILPGVEVKIADDGEILVKGPNVFVGYYKDELKTKDAFTQDGWFKTGDMGELDSDGFLFIKGRKKYLIKSFGGQNVYPEDIETELNKISGVQDSCVLGIEKNGSVEIHAVLLLDPNVKTNPEEIITKANENLSSYQHISGWTVWPDIDFPRTVTRKIKKEEVKKILKSKNKESKSISFEKKSRLIQILARITGINQNHINESTNIVKDLHLDSLMRVELVSWIEEDLGIIIEESDIKPTTTVKDLEEIIKSKKVVKEKPRLKKWPRSWWARLLRPIFQWIFFLFTRIFVKLRVEGIENLENLQLPAIFMPNHMSYLDSIVVPMAIPFKIRKRLSFAAAQDVLYEEYKILAVPAELLFNSFPLQRGEQENIKLGLDYLGQMLDNNYSVVIYPEGRMSESGQLQELKKGAGLVAIEMDVYVVPVKIVGTANILPYAKIIPRRRGEVKVIFGKPIKFSRSDSYALAMEKIYEKLREL